MNNWANEPHASGHKEWGGLLFSDAHILSGSQTKESTQKGFSLSYEILDRKLLFAPLYNSSIAFGFSKGSSTLNIGKNESLRIREFCCPILDLSGYSWRVMCVYMLYVCMSE